MSTKERHAKFKARGWQYVFGIGLNGNRALEIWATPDGELVHWAPGDDTGDTDYSGRSNGHVEGWKDAARRNREKSDEDAFKILQGVTLPEDRDKAAEIIKPYLTWDAPYFVGAANNRTIEIGTLVADSKSVIPNLERYETGQPIVAGPVGRIDGLGAYLEDRHERTQCGYWAIRIFPRGLETYSTRAFLNGHVDDDPRPVLPMEYWGHRGRAAVRREALTNAFDGCYERVRKIVDGDKYPERMQVAAETPEFVIFGKPGIKDKITEFYGVDAK